MLHCLPPPCLLDENAIQYLTSVAELWLSDTVTSVVPCTNCLHVRSVTAVDRCGLMHVAGCMLQAYLFDCDLFHLFSDFLGTVYSTNSLAYLSAYCAN